MRPLSFLTVAALSVTMHPLSNAQNVAAPTTASEQVSASATSNVRAELTKKVDTKNAAVGDQVMALYLPRIFPGEPADHMLADALALLAAAGYDGERPWVELGIGLDFGTAYVGNVGSGEVKDFTAIGDVVNTAARLQAAAASGEIVMSSRVHDRTGGHTANVEPRELSLKGKSEPEIAMVRRIDFAAPSPNAPAPT